MSSEDPRPTSRIPGFYELPVRERIARLVEHGLLSPESAQLLTRGALPVEVADRMSENVLACHALPLSVGLNFRVNQRDYVVPMAVEEPSIVAAASNAARLVRISGGFVAEADPPIMTAQISLDGVPQPEQARARIHAEKARWLEAADRVIPSMVERGGGASDLEVRVLEPESGMLVVHVYVHVGDAMGANLVDTVAEYLAPLLVAEIGGEVGLRILSNLPLRRCVRVECQVSSEALGGDRLADRIVRASRFAELDVFRGVTHNKGIMNGVDAVALALGQDWRAIEAGAHAYASLSGRYRPLAVWTRSEDGVVGRLEMPLAVATVGGSTRVHAGVRAAFEILRVQDARELATVMAAVGLASNLAALKALAGEGIQKGHMKLHRRKEAASTEAGIERSERSGA